MQIVAPKFAWTTKLFILELIQVLGMHMHLPGILRMDMSFIAADMFR